jgi:hypothetical protein
VDVNDCDELLDIVIEPLSEEETPIVLLTDSDTDTVADELVVCVSDTETDGDVVSMGSIIVELTDLLTDIDEVGSLLCDADADKLGAVLCDNDILTDSDKLGAVLCDADLLTDIDEVGSLLCDADVLADTDILGSVLADTDELPVAVSVDENDDDTEAEEEAVALELAVCDKV